MKNKLTNTYRGRRIFIFLHSLIIIAGFLWLVSAHQAIAANNCTITQGSAMNISLNISQLRPSKNGASGTVLARTEVSTAAISYNCGNLIKEAWVSRFTRPESTQQALDNVYNTNVAGVGIRLSWPASRNMYFPNTAECTSACMEAADKVVLEFVQTGTITGGTIPAGIIGDVKLSADTNPGPALTLMTISLGSPVDIETKSCAILTTSQNVNLGDYQLTDLQGTKLNGEGDKIPFTLVLSCPQQTSVQFKFTASNTPVGAPKGYINNCQDSGCAGSVGVRLLNNSNVAMWTDASAQDATGGKNKSTIIPAGEKTFGYKAEIYRLKSAKTITAGKIDTHVVFDILMN